MGGGGGEGLKQSEVPLGHPEVSTAYSFGVTMTTCKGSMRDGQHKASSLELPVGRAIQPAAVGTKPGGTQYEGRRVIK